GELLAATLLAPANVSGDGQSTVEQLITEKNKARRAVVGHRQIRLTPQVKAYLDEQGYSLSSVLQKDEQVFLAPLPSSRGQGDAIDMTDSISSSTHDLALQAVKVITGLRIAAVDIIVDSQSGDEVVMNVNP